MSTSARRRLMRDFKVRPASLQKLGEIGLWPQSRSPAGSGYGTMLGILSQMGHWWTLIPFVSEGLPKVSSAPTN